MVKIMDHIPPDGCFIFLSNKVIHFEFDPSQSVCRQLPTITFRGSPFLRLIQLALSCGWAWAAMVVAFSLPIQTKGSPTDRIKVA